MQAASRGYTRVDWALDPKNMAVSAAHPAAHSARFVSTAACWNRASTASVPQWNDVSDAAST
jgi:hypothetical protein